MLVCKKSGKKLVAFVAQYQNNDKGHLVFIYLQVVLAKGRQRGMDACLAQVAKRPSIRLQVGAVQFSLCESCPGGLTYFKCSDSLVE